MEEALCLVQLSAAFWQPFKKMAHTNQILPDSQLWTGGKEPQSAVSSDRKIRDGFLDITPLHVPKCLTPVLLWGSISWLPSAHVTQTSFFLKGKLLNRWISWHENRWCRSWLIFRGLFQVIYTAVHKSENGKTFNRQTLGQFLITKLVLTGKGKLKQETEGDKRGGEGKLCPQGMHFASRV